MPIGDFVNQIPAPVFLLIHLTAFLIGAYFAWRSFGAVAPLLGTAFSLFALAEISYMTYHLDWTVFLFAHTISEGLDLFAFIVVFVAATQRANVGSAASASGQCRIGHARSGASGGAPEPPRCSPSWRWPRSAARAPAPLRTPARSR